MGACCLAALTVNLGRTTVLTVVVAIARDCWLAHVKLDVSCSNKETLHCEPSNTPNRQLDNHGPMQDR
jgi:hypothetical protein